MGFKNGCDQVLQIKNAEQKCFKIVRYKSGTVTNCA